MNRRIPETLGLLALAAALASCAVGPNFKTPAAPTTDRYTPTPLATDTASANTPGGSAQTFDFGKKLPADWWTLYHSDAIDQLVKSSLASNPTLEAAQAALRSARASLDAQRGSLLFPNVSADLQGARERPSPLTTGVPRETLLDVFNASVNVSYTVDVFGSARRQLEAQDAIVAYDNWQIEATYLTLSANVVTTAIKEASLRAQLKATNEILDAQTKQLDLVQKQFSFGAVSRSVVLSQQTQVAQTRTAVAPLEKSLAQTRHQLSVLAGKLPSEGGVPEFTLDSLQLPTDLPVSLPSELVAQRPDIRAAEAALHEASALVGVAVANQYPQFTISGSYGAEALKFQDLFKGPSTVWSIGGGVLAPIFNGGALSAKRRAAEANYDQANAQYRQVVLQAFQNVADALRALDSDASALASSAQSDQLAHELFDLSTKQFKLGAISYLALLDAQRQYQQAHINLVQAEAARYADTAALFQALGGGWWNRESPIATVSHS